MIVGLLMLGGGAAAGVFGSLLGLGGGVLLVPLLTLGFGLPLREAVGVSLISVIVTSSAAAGVYLERHVANLRLGMTLELFTAIGALVGGSIAFLLYEQLLSLLFGALLLYVAATMARAGFRESPDTTTDTADPDPHPEHDAGPPDPPSTLERLSGPGYRVRNLGVGVMGATVAGLLSALLGIGGGIVKVPLMNLAMGVPFRVATATSNMMIGITATSSAVIYLLRDEINPYIAGPVALGVFAGASVGARVINRVDTRLLQNLFIAVLIVTAAQMAAKALGL